MKIFRITKFEIYSSPVSGPGWTKYLVTKIGWMKERTFFSKLNEKLRDNSL